MELAQPVIHSHLPVQHLLKKLETIKSSPRRKVRPAAINDLAGRVGELFVPLADIARVGYECRFADDRWEVAFYLGRTEIVGGKADGDNMLVSFQFDIKQLMELFPAIDRLEWNTMHPSQTENQPGGSFLSLDACWENLPIRLQILSVPPCQAGPGLRQYVDGRLETV